MNVPLLECRPSRRIIDGGLYISFPRFFYCHFHYSVVVVVVVACSGVHSKLMGNPCQVSRSWGVDGGSEEGLKASRPPTGWNGCARARHPNRFGCAGGRWRALGAQEAQRRAQAAAGGLGGAGGVVVGCGVPLGPPPSQGRGAGAETTRHASESQNRQS